MSMQAEKWNKLQLLLCKIFLTKKYSIDYRADKVNFDNTKAYRYNIGEDLKASGFSTSNIKKYVDRVEHSDNAFIIDLDKPLKYYKSDEIVIKQKDIVYLSAAPTLDGTAALLIETIEFNEAYSIIEKIDPTWELDDRIKEYCLIEIEDYQDLIEEINELCSGLKFDKI